ncbi:MAG: hypothetical protein ABMB14_00360 [Myxococcota bacterium]
MTPVMWSTVAAFAQEPADDGGSQAVGGSLAGWGSVPIATDEERADGVTHLWGQVQVWTTVFDQDVDPQADPATYGDPEADPGFSLRRARIGVDGYVPMGALGGASQVDYALALGVSAPYDVLSEPTPDVELVDAFGRWALPTGVGVTSAALGLQRVPFSRESMMSSANLVFEEVSVGTYWLTPSREVGATVSQSVLLGDGELAPQLLARIGGFNGSEDLFGDTGPGLLGTGRLEFSLGDTYRTWSPSKDPAIGIGAAALRDTQPSTRTTSIEADLLARISLVTLSGEVVTSRIRPTNTDVTDPSVVDNTGRLGWHAQLSVWLPIDGDDGIELAGRFATYDDAVKRDTNGDVAILHAGATWRNLLPKVDLGAGFVHRIEPDDAPNDTIRLWTQIRPDVRF